MPIQNLKLRQKNFHFMPFIISLLRVMASKAPIEGSSAKGNIHGVGKRCNNAGIMSNNSHRKVNKAMKK